MASWPNWLGSLGALVFAACTVGAVAAVLIALVGTRNSRLAAMLLGVACVTAVVAAMIGRWLGVDALRLAAGNAASELSPDSVRWLLVAITLLLTVAP